MDFAELTHRERELRTISDSTIWIEGPKTTLLQCDFPQNRVDISLTEMMCDKYLYESLLQFSRDMSTQVPLLCLRSILAFEEAIAESAYLNTLETGGTKLVWLIARHFLNDDDPRARILEFSPLMRKAIFYQLASPHKDLFLELKDHCTAMLRNELAEFQSSSAYADTITRMQNIKALQDANGFEKFKLKFTKPIDNLTSNKTQSAFN